MQPACRSHFDDGSLPATQQADGRVDLHRRKRTCDFARDHPPIRRRNESIDRPLPAVCHGAAIYLDRRIDRSNPNGDMLRNLRCGKTILELVRRDDNFHPKRPHSERTREESPVSDRLLILEILLGASLCSGCA